MDMTLKEQLVAILAAATSQGRSHEFAARAVLLWMDWTLDLSLSGNGWLDDDTATKDALYGDDVKQFLDAVRQTHLGGGVAAADDNNK
jgi:hypothetical protein